MSFRRTIHESNAMRFLTSAAGGAILITALSGCSEASAQVKDDAAVVHAQMWSSQERQIRNCMKKQGFDYVEESSSLADSIVVGTSPYALTLAQAEVSGFGYADDILSSNSDVPVESANDEIRNRLSESDQEKYDRALMGTATDRTDLGCRGEARRDAFEEFGPRIASSLLPNESLVKLIQSDGYRQFESDWAQCMTREGFETISFEEFHTNLVVAAADIIEVSSMANGELTSALDMQKFSSVKNREIQAAVNNVKCLEQLRPVFDDLLAKAS